MAVNYQKLYAYLVGQIDEAIGMLDLAMGKDDCGTNDLALLKGKLIGALQEAEERYIQEDESINFILDLFRKYKSKDEEERRKIEADLSPEELEIFRLVMGKID